MGNTESKKTSIFLVEDHPLIRTGLVKILTHEKDLFIAGESADPDDACRRMVENPPGLAIIDLTLGKGLRGLELIKDLRRHGLEMPILVLSMHDEVLYAERVISAGAQGFVRKVESTEKLLLGIRQVLSGQYFLSENIIGKVLARISTTTPGVRSLESTLSDREVEVLQYLGSGLTTRELAARLNLSPKTIETYREHLKEKLGLKNSAELVHYAVKWVQTQG